MKGTTYREYHNRFRRELFNDKKLRKAYIEVLEETTGDLYHENALLRKRNRLLLQQNLRMRREDLRRKKYTLVNPKCRNYYSAHPIHFKGCYFCNKRSRWAIQGVKNG